MPWFCQPRAESEVGISHRNISFFCVGANRPVVHGEAHSPGNMCQFVFGWVSGNDKCLNIAGRPRSVIFLFSTVARVATGEQIFFIRVTSVAIWPDMIESEAIWLGSTIEIKRYAAEVAKRMMYGRPLCQISSKRTRYVRLPSNQSVSYQPR